ncbi:MAG: lytic transglycosylase domain-containing protein [Myxococcales bacterium]|jgi:soluble lytic murein transglycosylase
MSSFARISHAAFRFGAHGGALLPFVLLLVGAGGNAVPASPAPASEPVAGARVERAPLPPEVAQIDRILAERAPELGLALRWRVAAAIIEESKAAGFDPLLVLGLIEVESEFDGVAVSWAGARGLMQLRPVTAGYLAELEGVRLTTEEIYRDPALQVRLGVRYLARLQKRFRSLDLALMAYNAGPEKLRQSLATGDIERFRNYPRAVRRNHARFRNAVRLAQENALAQADPVAGFPSDEMATP